MSALMQSLKEVSPVKLAAMAGTAVVLLGFFIFISTRVGTPMMAPLYSGLDMKDSAQIVEQLEKSGIPYEISAGGAQILVPSDQALRLRMSMAQQGLPNSGSVVGYEIFDRDAVLGTSNFVHSVNMLRALEGELARTISSFQKVDNARVHLVLPKRELFTRERQKTSASVALTLRGVNELSKSEVAAIRNLVSSAVPELAVNEVTVVDSKGKMLARGGSEDDLGMMADTAAEYRVAYERRTRDQVESMLENILGYGRVRAEVTADINFDRIVTNSETFDPEGQVARSVQSTEETESNREKDQQENVSVGNQLPDATVDNAGTSNESNRSLVDEITNYEISKVVENHIRETGNVNRLSVAVLVDGTYSTDEEGNQIYQPRSEEELAKIATLVRSSVGFDVDRGDNIEVVNMQFSERPVTGEADGPFEWLKQDLQGIIQTLVIGIVAILAILLIIRPIVNRVIEVSSQTHEDDEEEALADHLALLGPDLTALTDQREHEEEEMINIEHIQGKVRSSAVKRVQDILENNPDEALGALRRWMEQRNVPA
ncbi:MAG: flagellar M-ring protein FliF [Alphaproteobacteria bacterium]|nr:flagellar M-ring protein FliF [Alphaproteobacteria bacterium]